MTGFVNDSKDPGGATILGVSLRFLKSTGLVDNLNRDGVMDERDIQLIKLDDAQDL